MSSQTIKLKQYIAIPISMIEDYPSCDSRAIFVWSLIYDRYRSSIGKADFYDKKVDEYYAIFTNADLANKLNIKDPDTVSKYIQQLRNAGLLITKKTPRGALKLFPILPEVYLASEEVSETPLKQQPQEVEDAQPQKTGTNHSTSIHPSLTDNTDNTSSEDKARILKEHRFKAIAQSQMTQGGIPADAVSIMTELAFHDPDKLYEYGTLIYKAKNSVKKRAQKVRSGELAVRFETNPKIQETFADAIRLILIKSQKVGKTWQAYATRSLQNYFEEQANAYLMQM